MTNDKSQQAPSDLSKDGEKTPETGSHEDFGQNDGTAKAGGEKSKDNRKEETGATESGQEDKGAKE